METLYKIVELDSNQTLFKGGLKECESMLEYFLNHGHDAFLEEIKA